MIADPTRRQLLTELAAGERSVGYLVEAVGVSQPTVSKHLRVLRDAHLVSIRAQGQKRFYALESGPLQEVVEWVAGLLPHPDPAPEAAEPRVGEHPEGRAVEQAEGSAVEHSEGSPVEQSEVAVRAPAAPDDSVDAAGRRGNGVGRTMEQVTGRAQELLDRLAKQRFGRRR